MDTPIPVIDRAQHCGSTNEAHNNLHGRTITVCGHSKAEVVASANDVLRSFIRDCTEPTCTDWWLLQNEELLRAGVHVRVHVRSCTGFTVLARIRE